MTADVFTDESGMTVGFKNGDDVEALLTDRSFRAVAMDILALSGVTEGPLHDMWSLLMFGKDGAGHSRLRRPVSKAFTPRAVERYRPAIEEAAEALADRMAEANGPVELWESFARPLAARAACGVVGIPDTDADRVAAWAIDLVGAFFFMDDDMRVRAEAAADAFQRHLDRHFEALREQPGHDVASQLLGVCIDADANIDHDLSTDEIRALVANLVFGGLEATAKVLTTGSYHLQVEGRWKTLAEHPEHLGHAVAELLRFSPPIGPARVAADDVTLRDVPLCAGQLAVLFIEQAGRDPERYEEPESLIVEREPGRQLAFGAGPHFCLGANLAKVVLETGFSTLTQRFPDLVLAGEEGETVWDHNTFHGIVELHVEPDPTS